MEFNSEFRILRLVFPLEQNRLVSCIRRSTSVCPNTPFGTYVASKLGKGCRKNISYRQKLRNSYSVRPIEYIQKIIKSNSLFDQNLPEMQESIDFHRSLSRNGTKNSSDHWLFPYCCVKAPVLISYCLA